MAVPEELLSLLVCPECHGALTEASDALVCDGCRLRYPVRDGIPIMLAEEATRGDEPR